MPQYFKLRKKVEAGARFVINQIGWNARKDDELLRWIRREELPVSVLANVYLLSPTAARAFHQGKIPGVVVTDELLALAERHGASADKGRAFFVDLAAKHVAVARGLGFDGVYLGGHMPASTFGEILDLAGSFADDDWRAFASEIHYPFADEFYFFEPDPETKLSSGEVNAAYLESKRRRKTELRVPLKYRFSRKLHAAAFEPDAPLYPAGRAFYRAVDKIPPRRKTAHALEQAAKVPLFGCRDCGDCSLPDIAYVCPESQCAKNQRNGPCGGTRDGLCEIYDTECIWSQAYERLKAYGEEESMLDGPVIVKDNALARTSAWANAFLGRDHHGRARRAGERPTDALSMEPRLSYSSAASTACCAARLAERGRAGRPRRCPPTPPCRCCGHSDGLSNAQLARRSLVTPQSMSEVLALLVEQRLRPAPRGARPRPRHPQRADQGGKQGARALRPRRRRGRAGDAARPRRRRGGEPPRRADPLRPRARA